jgi:crotonobetainyl-CoA:carnitine CoA-transferase CaiB-like acyl-CoA transferase
MRPLEGVRVVEAGSYVLAPFASLQLADLGADVIKIEPPNGGDPFRRFGQRHNGTGLIFANCNRNKRSEFLDLKSDVGAARFRELLASADVLISNWRPAVAERLGFSSDMVRATFPRLIWVRVSGFGQSGPLSDLPAFDSILQARSGYAARAEGPPVLANGYLADKIAGTLAAEAALAALFKRERASTAGAIVDVSMLDAMAYFDSPDLLAGDVIEDHQYPAVLRHLSATRPVKTLDGWMVVSPVSGRQLAATVRATGHGEWVEELRSIEDAATMTKALFSRLDTVLPTKTTIEWERVFAEVDVPASAVLDVAGHLADPQVVHNEMYHVSDDPTLGRIRRARHAALFDGAPVDTDDLAVPELAPEQ